MADWVKEKRYELINLFGRVDPPAFWTAVEKELRAARAEGIEAAADAVHAVPGGGSVAAECALEDAEKAIRALLKEPANAPD